MGLFSALIPKLASLPRELLERFYFLQVDERLFEEHNQDGLRDQIYSSLVASGLVREAQIINYPLPKDRTAREVEASSDKYLRILEGLGGRFQIAILGTGEDGHVAGTFPHHPTSEVEDVVFFTYDESPKPPPGRVTATLPLLAESDLGILIITGEAKRQAMMNFLNPQLSLQDCPAKIVREMDDYILLTDLDAESGR